MTAQVASILEFHLKTTSQITRITLPHGRIFTVPTKVRLLTLVAGRAWLTMDGEDVILCAGECVTLNPNSKAILSSLNKTDVQFEVA